MSVSKIVSGAVVIAVIVTAYVYLMVASSPEGGAQRTQLPAKESAAAHASGKPPQATASATTPTGSVNFTGKVAKPGLIAIPPQGLSLAQAFALAGGAIPSAGRYVTITRMNPDGSQAVLQNVDLLTAVKQGKDVPLQKGDVIDLGESILGPGWN